jgi:hypothetical protein
MNREIQALVDELQEMNPKFVPPADWKNLKKSRKIYLPETGDNQNNYAGTVLGQGGQVQKRLEAKTGCKIAIRGRQSYMKRRYDYDPTEQTHVLIQAENDEDVSSWLPSLLRVLPWWREFLEENQKSWKKTRRMTCGLSLLLTVFCQKPVRTVVNSAIKYGNAQLRSFSRSLRYNAKSVMTSPIQLVIAQ